MQDSSNPVANLMRRSYRKLVLSHNNTVQSPAGTRCNSNVKTTSYWRNNDVIVASWDHWGLLHIFTWYYRCYGPAPDGEPEPHRGHSDPPPLHPALQDVSDLWWSQWPQGCRQDGLRYRIRQTSWLVSGKLQKGSMMEPLWATFKACLMQMQWKIFFSIYQMLLKRH